MAVFPVFLKLAGRRVVVVGGGPVAASKLRSLIDAEASVTVIAPEVVEAIASAPVEVVRRPFRAEDLDGAWYVVAAAPPDVNRAVAAAAHERNLFVNAVDDLENASAYLGAVLRRAGVTIALSTDGEAPALAGLMREALEAGTARRFGHVDGNRARRATAVAGGGHSDGAATPAVARGAGKAVREAVRRSVASAEREFRRSFGEPARSGAGRRGPASDGDGGSGGAKPPGWENDESTRERWSARSGDGSARWRGPRRSGFADTPGRTTSGRSGFVLYDALIDPAVLDLAPTARRVYVGKRAGRHSVSQEFINKLMVRAARARPDVSCASRAATRSCLAVEGKRRSRSRTPVLRSRSCRASVRRWRLPSSRASRSRTDRCRRGSSSSPAMRRTAYRPVLEMRSHRTASPWS